MLKLSPKPRKAFRFRFGLAALMACLVALLLIGTLSTIARADNPTPTAEEESTTLTQADIDGVDLPDVGHHMTAAELDQIKQLRAGTLSEAQVAQIKALASQKLVELGPLAIKKLEAKSEKKQETRLIWIAVAIILVIPLLALIGFLAYPLIIRKSIRKRAPNATLKQIYALYLPQALLVTLVLLVLGGSLWGVQFVTGRVLGGITNPQMVFQRESIHYIINNRDELMDNYQDIMVGLANDITDGDPEKPIMDIILDNVLQLKDDPVVNAANNIIQFVMPFLNYISLITFGILLLLFLIRIRPDIMRLLKYPVDILEAEDQHRILPVFNSVSVGAIPASQTPGETMRVIGRRLMWNEVKVMSVFALTLLGFAVVISLALILFFGPLVGWVVDSVNTAAEYFLRSDDGANLLVWAAIVLMLFLIECILVFLVSFIFALVRLQGVIRLRFAGTLDNKQTVTFVRQLAIKFAWVMLVVAVLGMGLPFLAGIVDDLLYNHGHDPSWVLIILATPLVLIVGLNLGLWLVRGFKTLVRMLTTTPQKVFNLKKDSGKKLEPVAS
jgi:hypothetical protein